MEVRLLSGASASKRWGVHDREQAEASNELAAQWVADELSDFSVSRVGVIGGEVMVGRARAEALEPAHH